MESEDERYRLNDEDGRESARLRAHALASARVKDPGRRAMWALAIATLIQRLEERDESFIRFLANEHELRASARFAGADIRLDRELLTAFAALSDVRVSSGRVEVALTLYSDFAEHPKVGTDSPSELVSEQLDDVRVALLNAKVSEARLKLATRALALGIFEVSQHGIRADRRVQHLLACAPQPSIFEFCQAFRDGKTFEEEVRALSLAARREVSESEVRAPLDGIDEELELVEGGWLKLVIEAMPDGRLVGVVADISERRARTEELRSRIANQQRLVGIVSHDLKSPLGAVRMGLSMLKIDGPQQRILERIRSAATRADELVRDMLDHMSARKGHGMHVERADMELRPLIEQCVARARLRFPETSIKMDVEEGLHLSADGSRLSQMVANLLSNAAKYGDPSGVVEVTGTSKNHHVVLCVKNDGEPISRARLHTIFDPWVTTDVRRRATVGLGLSIVKQIVDAHDGNIDVQSSKEHGTRFQIQLPRA